MQNLSPRIATPKDLAIVQKCISDSFGPYTELLGRTPIALKIDFRPLIEKNEVYLFESSSEVVGMVVLSPQEDHLYLGNMAVPPQFQRKGYAKIILTYAEEIAKKKGLHEMRLFTTQEIPHLQEIYVKYGYEETHKEDHLIFFRKLLKNSW